MYFTSLWLIGWLSAPQYLSVTEKKEEGKRCYPFYCTVKLKRITYPSGCTLCVHLMSFMGVPKYELSILQQTTPLSFTET